MRRVESSVSRSHPVSGKAGAVMPAVRWGCRSQRITPKTAVLLDLPQTGQTHARHSVSSRSRYRAAWASVASRSAGAIFAHAL